MLSLSLISNKASNLNSEIFSKRDTFFNWDSLYARLNNYCEEATRKKKYKKIKAYRKSVYKEPADKSFLLILDLSEVKDQQFVAYLRFPLAVRNASTGITVVFHARQYGNFIEIQSHFRRKKFYRMNQGSNFLGDSFSNRDNVTAPIRFRGKRQPRYL